MELDDLKAAWQNDAVNYTKANIKNAQYLQEVLNGKTADLITSMKKRYEKIISAMLGSMILMVLVFPMLSDGFTYPGSVNGFAKAMFFYLVLIIFYWVKLKIVNHLELSDHLKERMEQLLKLLRKNLRMEVTFGLLFFMGLLLIGRFFYGKGLENLNDTGFLIGLPLSVLMVGILIFLINKRYKKQITELETYLAEYDQTV